MSGGAGTRLWPLSRQTFPKQLLPIVAEDESMLQETAARVSAPAFSPPIIVAGEEHRFFVKGQLENAKVKADAILLEPVGRNTATVAALAALWVLASGKDELILLMPSDHAIHDVRAFHEAIQLGIPCAQAGGLVTFGVRPDEPNTQYGYIELGDPHEKISGIHLVSRFVEKPGEARAREYFESGRFAWNSGIFLFQASAFIEEMRRHLPDSLEAISRSMKSPQRDGLFIRPDPVHSPMHRIFPSIMASWKRPIAGLSCRSTWAGPMWAHGRHSGKFRPATNRTTFCKATYSCWTVEIRWFEAMTAGLSLRSGSMEWPSSQSETRSSWRRWSAPPMSSFWLIDFRLRAETAWPRPPKSRGRGDPMS